MAMSKTTGAPRNPQPSAPPAYADAPPPYGAPHGKDGPVRYTAVSASQHCVYLCRSDGVVDRSTGKGKVSAQLVPEYPHKYVDVSAGHSTTYLLRSDGVIVFTKGSGKTHGVESEIRPPPGQRYVWASAGPIASYFVRSDGKAERSKGSGRISGEVVPKGWPAVKYLSVAAGLDATFFVRDDGCVDRFTKPGSVKTMEPSRPGTKYTSVGDQLTITRSNGQTTYTVGNYAVYLIRDDGVAVRTCGSGKIDRDYEPPSGDRYVSASSGEQASYLVRASGLIDRVTGASGGIEQTIDGTKRDAKADDGAARVAYVDVSAGETASYLLRADGLVDRSYGSGVVSSVMTPISKEEFDARSGGCTVA